LVIREDSRKDLGMLQADIRVVVALAVLLGGCRNDPTFDAPCESPSDCEVAIDQCCECEAGVDAILGTRRAAHRRHVCGRRFLVCPECQGPLRPDLGATCNAGVCELYDLRTSPIAACSRDEDCVLRVAACCECGGDTRPSALVAIARDRAAEYRTLVCAPDAECAACEPIYPAEARAICAADGHCSVAR
jgi:hypothetical protein